jgi:hypothetical protein
MEYLRTTDRSSHRIRIDDETDGPQISEQRNKGFLGGVAPVPDGHDATVSSPGERISTEARPVSGADQISQDFDGTDPQERDGPSENSAEGPASNQISEDFNDGDQSQNSVQTKSELEAADAAESADGQGDHENGTEQDTDRGEGEESTGDFVKTDRPPGTDDLSGEIKGSERPADDVESAAQPGAVAFDPSVTFGSENFDDY